MYAELIKSSLLLLGTLFVTFVQTQADEDYVHADDSVTKLAHIYNLSDHCVVRETRCGGFNYPETDRVAFFDLQTEVRIAPDGATYDLGAEQRGDTLIFENSTFAHFPLHLFYGLELSELDMRNCSVQHVSWECFLMANKLVILLLSDNKIKTLDENTFNYASELQFLFLSRNKLRILDAQSFKGLHKLQHLDLSENRLRTLPPGLFDDLPSLRHLTLAENRLVTIPNDIIANNPALLTVTLHTNRLRELNEYAFRTELQAQSAERVTREMLAVDVSHNQQLEVLVLKLNTRELWARNCSLSRVNIYGSVKNVDLKDNRLTELYFSESESLQHLVLRNNSLMQLATLSRVPHLQHLDLADNPALNELPAGWQTPALKQLDISHTSLKQLPLEALQGMPQLRKLNISANKLTEIQPSAFEQLSQLTHFFIHANDWNCYNLNLVMDVLIRPNGISYTVDDFDPNFPGEYVNGIACMYRLSDVQNTDKSTEELPMQDIIASASMEQPQKLSVNPALQEVQKLRQELKAVVQVLEEKFDRTFEQLNQLNAQMKVIQELNSTLWNQMTITV